MDIENKLQQLRQEWRSSSEIRRKEIEKEAEELKTTKQCYFEENGTRCIFKSSDYWCSQEHKIAWQEANYINREKRRMTIQEMQANLKKMGIEKRKKDHVK